MSDLITVKEAAIIAGRSPKQIYEWIKSGELSATVDGAGRKRVSGIQVLEVEAARATGRTSAVTLADLSDTLRVIMSRLDTIHGLLDANASTQHPPKYNPAINQGES